MKAKETVSPDERPRQPLTTSTGIGRLRRFNLAMGGLHLVQGILMVLLSSSFALPLVANFLYFNPQTKRLVPQPETLVNVRLGPAIAAFLFLSAIAHFAVASPSLYPWYVRNVRRGINPARWLGVSFGRLLGVGTIL